MHRIAAVLLSALSLALGGQRAFAQTIATINSASPSSVTSGSGDTAITLTMRQSGTTRYNVCFYNGTTSNTIVPTAYNFQNAQAVTYTFTVPGAQFQTGTSARTNSVYLATTGASIANGCTGTNSYNISNVFSYTTTESTYSLRTASPSTLASGAANTSITITGAMPTFPTNGSGLGLCFYAGTNNSPILPTNQTSTSSVAFSVPAATFNNPATAKIYLATASSTCTGSNTAYSNSLSFTISQGMRFNIQSAYPSSLPAGGGNVAVSLYGNLQGTNIPNNGVCIYTGPNTTPTAITPTAFTTTEIDFVVPASALQIAPANFSSGIYNAQVQLGASGGACTTTAQGISNVYTLPISYPTVTSASASYLPDVNLNANYTYLPTNIELYGSNFGSKFAGRFIPSGGTQYETTGFQIDQNDATVQLVRPSVSTGVYGVYGCNYSQGNVYEYCSTTPLNIKTYKLSGTTTQIASSPASPSPGSPVTLNATVTQTGGVVFPDGSLFTPGPPTGTVTFSDNGTSLGTATLAPGALSLAPTSTQQINIYAGTDSAPVSGGTDRSAAVPTAATPNETPSPNINSQFSSLMADFNKDGINDTLIIQSTSGIFHLFLGGSPLGTLQAEQTIYPGGYYSCSSLAGVTVADFNGDGFPDLAYLCGDSGGFSYLQVLLNLGDGSFGSTPINVAYGIANQLAAADVNKDGKMDLVASGNTGTFCCTGQTFGIQVYTGDGTGNFTTGTLTTTADVPGTQVVLKDLNNDGAPDLTFLHYDATNQRTEVSIWQNNGSGGFTKLTPLPICNCQVTNTKLFVTPLTTSSLYPDIVVDYAEASNILTFVNKKAATIGFTAVSPALYSNLIDVVLGDFNGDGFTDFVQYNGTNFVLELGNGTGTFALNTAAFAPYAVGTGTANLASLATAPDLNGDGYADLIAIFPTATSSSSTIVSYVTTGTAVASLPTTLNTAGSRTITTVYTGNRNVLGNNGSQAVTVGRTAPTINWTPSATTNTTTPLGSSILNATAASPTGATVPGSFAYTPAAGSFLAAGTQTITAVFTPTDTNTYSAVTTTRNVTVSKTTPVITTTINPGNHTYTPNLATTYTAFVTGTNIVPTGAVQFNSNGSPTGSLAGLSQSGTAQSSTAILFSSLPAGTFAFTGTYQGDAVYNAVTSAVTNYTVSQSTPALTYAPTPTSIAYGTGLVAAQLNATAVDPNTGASIPGTVTYSTPGFTSLQTGSVLPAGTNVITASFTPTDSQDYAATSRTATINVSTATTTTAVTVSPTTITPGQSTRLFVTVTPNPSGSAVTGLVTFSDDNGTIPNAQVTLSNGTASLNYTPSAIGTHRISAAYAGTVNYSPSSSTTPATFTVTQKNPTITYAPTPATIVYGTGLVASQLNATAVDPSTGAAVPGAFTYATPTIPSVQTGTILPVGTNIVTAKFTPTDTTTYATIGQGATITVTRATPSITYNANPASIIYGTPLAASLFNAAASVPGSFTYNPTLGTVLPVGTRSVTLTFTPTDTADYTTVANTAQVVVTQATPTVTFLPNPATLFQGQPLTANQLNATANVPGSFAYNPTLGTVLPTGANTITAVFTPTDATNYTSVTKTAVVTVTSRLTPVLTYSPTPSSITYGTGLVASQLTASAADPNSGSTVPGAFTFATSTGTVRTGSILPTGTNTVTATFTPTDGTTYNTATKTATIIVAQAAPVITWNPTASTNTTTPLASGGILNATANVPGTYAYTPSSGYLPAGIQTISLTFTPTDTANYSSFTTTRNVTVSKTIPSISTTVAGYSQTYDPSARYTYTAFVQGTSNIVPTGIVQVTNSGSPFGNPGTLSPSGLQPAQATASVPLALQAGTYAFTMTYLGDAIYSAVTEPASATRYPTVAQANPTVTFVPNPATITQGQPLTAAQLNATANIPGSFAYSPALGTVLPAGPNTITATFTPTDTTNYNTATKTAVVTVTSKLNPVINFAPNPATITYGTPLTSAQLNAVETSGVPGAFSYSSPLGTILPVGANTITATFTPTDATTYNTVTQTATITVTRATPVITWTPAATTTTTTPVDATLLNATANVPGAFAYTPALGSFLPAGTQTLRAVFTPTDTLNYASITTTAVTNVAKTATSAVLTANPSSLSSPGTPTALSVLLSGVNITPTGNIQFFDGTTFLGASGLTGPSAHNAVASINTTLAAGPHTLFATYNGDPVYLTATSNSLSYLVGGATPPITFAPNPATIPYGTPLSAAQLNATTTVPGVFTYSPALNTILDAGVNTITATFTPTDTATYATTTKTATVTVTQFAPVIVWVTPAAITFGTPLSSTQLNAVANDINGAAIPGTYTYAPPAGTVLPAGTTQDTVTFTPTNTTNFAAATATRAITVTSAATTNVLTLSANPITVGQSVTLTSTLTSLAGTPTGTVTFFQNGGSSAVVIGAVSLVNGVATVSFTPPNSGTYLLVASYNGGSGFSGSNAQTNLVVNAATVPFITWNPNPTTVPYGTVLSAAQLNAFEASSIPGVITYSSPLGTLFDVGPHVVTATFTPTDTVRYTTVTKTATFTVTQFTPAITWLTPASIPNGTPLSATQLNAVARDLNGANVPGTYTYNPPAGTVLPLGTTQDTVTFTPTNTLNFATATAAVPITVVLLPTTTTLTVSPNPIALGQSVTVTATVTPSAATGSVQFADNSGTIAPSQVALVNGVATFTYTPTTAGTHLITASYLGATSYATSSATPVALVVGQGAPVITFTPNPASIPYGTPLSAAQLNATSTLPGTFAYSQPLGTILDAGVYTITATFTPTDTTSYSTVTKTATVTVTRFTPVITWPAYPQAAYGRPISATQLNAVANDLNGNPVPGTYTYNPAPGALLPVGDTPATVNFTPTNTLNFNSATGTNTIHVNRQQTNISVTLSQSSITLGQSITATVTVTPTINGTPTGTVSLQDFNVNPNIVASGPINNGVATFTYTPQTVGSHSFGASYSGDTNYEISLTNISTPPTLTVIAPTPTIIWRPNPATLPVGSVLTSAQLNATATDSSTGAVIPGTFVYNPTSGTPLARAAAQTLSVSFTPNDLTKYSATSATTTLTVVRANPVITWATPAPINQGTPLSAAQLNAVVVPGQYDLGLTLSGGTYTYTPAAGTILAPGVQTLSVTFTPGDTADYNTVTQTVQLTVLNAVTATLLTSSVNPSVFGQPVVLTTTIAQAGTLTTPVTGTVTFYEGDTPLAEPVNVIANAAGATATLTLSNLATGTHQLTAVYSGDANYLRGDAEALTQTVTIAPTTLNWTPTVATIPYGTPLTAAQLNAAPVSPYISTVTGLLTYTPPAGTILQAGSQTLTATFTPTDTRNLLPAAGSTVINVTQLTPTIAWAAPTSIVQGTPLSATQLNATATGLNNAALPGTFTYTPAAGTILPTGATTLRVLFTPADLTNYTTATASVPLTVTSANTSLSLILSANDAPAVTVTSGTVVTLTATLAAAGASPVYGQVNFCDTTAPTCAGTHIVGSAQLTAAGTATLRLIPAIGGHSYQAAFLGTKTSVASTSASSPLVVTGTYPTVTTFTTTGTTGNFTLTAVVTGTGNPTAAPGGTVSFLDTSNAGAPLATASLTNPTLTQSFATQSNTASGVTGQVILAADFNNDGIPDIVTSKYDTSSSANSSQTFTVSLGNGDGTFALKADLPSQGTQVVAGDFNHDGTLDLAVSNYDNTNLFILFGNGDGTFSSRSTATIPAGTGNLLVGDFNHDGILDLLSGSDVYNAATNTTTGTLTALLGAGDGTFSTVSSATLSPASGIVSNDFNNDGIPDLLATGTVGAGGITNTVLLGKGDGTFTAKSTFSSQNGGDIFASADLNNDGNADLASVNFYDSSISTYLGKGDGTFTFKATLQNPTDNQQQYDSFSIVFADVNHDGIPDIATVADDGIFLYNGAGDGTFNLTYQTVPQTDAGEDYGLAVADFNNDGFIDVATSAQLFADSSTHVVLGFNTVTSTATATAANVSPIGSGAHQIVATYPGDTSFKSSTSAPINLGGETFTPVLTWDPAPLTLGTALGTAQLNAVARNTSGTLIPGVFAYTPAAGAILPVGRQPLSVTFTPSDLVTYTVATLATTVQVNPLSTATVLTSSANPAAFAAPINLIATLAPVGGSSSTPITGSVTFLEGANQLGTAQVVNNTATLPISTLGTGNHLLTAVYSGDTAGNYLTSTSPVFTQVINTTTPTLTWTPAPATIVYGTRLTSAQLNATAKDVTGATLPGTFTYNPAAGTILPAGTQTLSVSFTPTNTVRYTTTTATTALTVTRATPTLVWNTPAPINQGNPLSTTQLNATATGIDGLPLPGTFTYNPAAGAILSAGSQTLTVTFTPTDAANYLTNTASVALTVLNPTTATVLTSSVNPSQFGQPIVLTATIAVPTRGTTPPSGNVTFFDGTTQIGDPAPITITSTGATATLTVATLGAGTHQLTAVYANDPNYVTSSSLPLTQTITIAPVTLAWTPTVAAIPYGTPLSAAQLNAVPVSPFVPNVSGLLTYTPAAGSILNAGTQTLNATFTPTDTADFLPAAGSAVITVTQATPTITWPTPAGIAQGTALSAAQLNAVATGINGQSLPGTYTYTPAAGTVLQAGITTLGVVFTPTDTANYTTATATVPLTVSIPATVSTIVSSLNPSQSGQAVIFTATVAQTGTSTQPLTGTVTFYDGTTPIITSPLTSGSATYTTAALSVTTHKIRFIYNGTADYATSISNTINQVVGAAATSIAWTPNPASIVYGTPLSAAQLNAVASSATATIPGTFTYTPAAGTILNAGTQTLNVTFTPTDAVNFNTANATTSITVSKATPTVTFPAPASVPVGTILSTTQLAATAAGVTGAAIPGTFTYTPAAGTAVTAGPQTLTVLFTPTDTANYTTATATTTLNGTAVTLTALSSTTASLGDPAKTITLTGTGFVSNSVARSNGVGLATTYVNPTTLTAILPATSFRTVQTLQITVNNPTQSQTTAALPFTVSAPAVVIKVNAPATANPGDQPSITSALAAAYPVDVTGTFNLTFTPISGGVVDPAIQFSTGGTTSAFTIPAGQTTNPNLQIQTGTVAGVITVRLALSAGGVDVTPAGLAPLVINVPTIAPTITSVTLTRSGRQLTVRTLGFSNTREVTKATFHFTPATGQQIQTPDVTVDVGAIFAGWYSQTASTAYGSTFLYTQTFTLDDDATVVGQVTVTLGNSVGASASGSSQ